MPLRIIQICNTKSTLNITKKKLSLGKTKWRKRSHFFLFIFSNSFKSFLYNFRINKSNITKSYLSRTLTEMPWTINFRKNCEDQTNRYELGFESHLQFWNLIWHLESRIWFSKFSSFFPLPWEMEENGCFVLVSSVLESKDLDRMYKNKNKWTE